MWITREEMEEYMSLASSRKDNVSKKINEKGEPMQGHLIFPRCKQSPVAAVQ
jgi:hypothetical protein